jgi:hypothetical protein
VLLPVEVAAIDQQAADRGAVAANIFGGRIDDDRRAMLERLAQDRAGSVVHDQRNAERTADIRDFLDREHLQLRVGQRFRVIGAGLLVGRLAEILRVGRVDEAHLDALSFECVREQVPSAAVEIGRADDVVARLGDVLDRHRGGGLSGAHSQRRDAAFERGDALLKHGVRRVHDAGVDIAEFLQPEQVGGVLGAAELIGRRLVDRHCHRPRRRVGSIATAMQSEGLGIL